MRAQYLAWRDEHQRAEELSARKQLDVDLSKTATGEDPTDFYWLVVKNKGAVDVDNARVRITAVDDLIDNQIVHFPYDIPTKDDGPRLIHCGSELRFRLMMTWHTGRGSELGVAGLDGDTRYHVYIRDKQKWTVHGTVIASGCDETDFTIHVAMGDRGFSALLERPSHVV